MSAPLRLSSTHWLKNERLAAGMTRSEFAEKIGVTERTVFNWETRGLPTNGPAVRAVEQEFCENAATRRQPGLIWYRLI